MLLLLLPLLLVIMINDAWKAEASSGFCCNDTHVSRVTISLSLYLPFSHTLSLSPRSLSHSLTQKAFLLIVQTKQTFSMNMLQQSQEACHHICLRSFIIDKSEYFKKSIDLWNKLKNLFIWFKGWNEPTKYTARKQDRSSWVQITTKVSFLFFASTNVETRLVKNFCSCNCLLSCFKDVS